MAPPAEATTALLVRARLRDALHHRDWEAAREALEDVNLLSQGRVPMKSLGRKSTIGTLRRSQIRNEVTTRDTSVSPVASATQALASHLATWSQGLLPGDAPLPAPRGAQSGIHSEAVSLALLQDAQPALHLAATVNAGQDIIHSILEIIHDDATRAHEKLKAQQGIVNSLNATLPFEADASPAMSPGMASPATVLARGSPTAMSPLLLPMPGAPVISGTPRKSATFNMNQLQETLSPRASEVALRWGLQPNAALLASLTPRKSPLTTSASHASQAKTAMTPRQRYLAEQRVRSRAHRKSRRIQHELSAGQFAVDCAVLQRDYWGSLAADLAEGPTRDALLKELAVVTFRSLHRLLHDGELPDKLSLELSGAHPELPLCLGMGDVNGWEQLIQEPRARRVVVKAVVTV